MRLAGCGLVIAAATLSLLAGTHVAATEPFDLPAELNDTAGVLSERGEIERAQDDLVAATGLQLFIVTVPDTSGQQPDAWLDETAGRSGLGDQDLALLVAVDDAELALRVPAGTGLSGSEVDRIRRDATVELAAGNPEAAVQRVALGLEDATWRDPATAGQRMAWWLMALTLAVTGAVLLWAGSGSGGGCWPSGPGIPNAHSSSVGNWHPARSGWTRP